MPTCCSASAFELACYLAVRSDSFYPKTSFAIIAASTLSAMLLPLFLTATSSFGAASEICYDRIFDLKNQTFTADVDSQYYDLDWTMGDVAHWHLLPFHVYNSVSVATSLVGLWVWLFSSPHRASERAQNLDRTCTTAVLLF